MTNLEQTSNGSHQSIETTPSLPIFDETIEDVGASTNRYIRKHYSKHIAFAIFITLLWEFFAIPLFFINSDFGIFVFAPFFIFLFLYAYVRDRIGHVFMEQFAKANNYSYERSGVLENIRSHIAEVGRKMGHSEQFADIISGTYGGYPIKLFYYSYVVGYGKHRQTYKYTIFEVEFRDHVNIPDIFLSSTGRLARETSQVSLQLEGDFNKYFTLYAPKDYEIETLQIFSPDFMAELIDKAQQYDLELTGNRMYLSVPYVIEKKDFLMKMYEIVRDFTPRLGPLLEKIKITRMG